MNGSARTGENVGHPVIGKPASEIDAAIAQTRTNLVRISDPVNPGLESEPDRRLDQKFAELAVALVIAPVADPDEIDAFAGFTKRMENRPVGRFMPGEYPPAPASRLIDLTQYFAEGEDCIISPEIEAGDLMGGGNGAMMRIMEEEYE